MKLEGKDVRRLIGDGEWHTTGQLIAALSPYVPYAQAYNIEPVSIRDERPILKNPLEVVDGYITVPTGPGLGLEFDEAEIRRWAGKSGRNSL